MSMLFPNVKCFYKTLVRLEEEELEVFMDGKIVIHIDLEAAKIDLKKHYYFELQNSPLAELEWLKIKIK